MTLFSGWLSSFIPPCFGSFAFLSGLCGFALNPKSEVKPKVWASVTTEALRTAEKTEWEEIAEESLICAYLYFSVPFASGYVRLGSHCGSQCFSGNPASISNST